MSREKIANKRQSDSQFATALRKALMQQNISQIKLAEISGLSRSNLSDYANGKTDPGFKTVIKIAESLGLGLVPFLALGKDQGDDPCPEPESGTFPPYKPETDEISETLKFRLALKAYIKKDGDGARAKNKDALAQASGVDRKLLNKIYLGEKEADADTQLAIAKAVDIPLADFLESGHRQALDYKAATHAKPKPVNNDRLRFRSRPVPVFGLASCGFNGWERKVPVSISASPLVFGPEAFAVIAHGQSMIPAGICPGMFCYCDPDVEPINGDAVYVYDARQNLGTIKEFVGWGPEAGAKEGWLRLHGWNDPDQFRRQTDFFLEIPGEHVSDLAVVICVRRRM